jgi:sugar O-acyltransferase (sialic acid O-acetyltransferase NeuD family)
VSEPRSLAIVGAGGHGKVVADCAREMGRWATILFVDQRYPELQRCGPWPVVGRDLDELAMLEPARLDIAVAIGANRLRLAWLDRIAAAGLTIATIQHPRATVSRSVDLGVGTVVIPGAVINMDAQIGRGCIVNTGATVDHDCVLGEGVHVAPGANLGGGSRIGACSWIGIGAAVRQGVTIGRDVTVGAAAAVISPVPDGVTVLGVPARIAEARPTVS